MVSTRGILSSTVLPMLVKKLLNALAISSSLDASTTIFRVELAMCAFGIFSLHAIDVFWANFKAIGPVV